MRGRVEHIDLAEAADALVLAPATADLMARLVHGVAPDALTALVLASRAPLIVCPAMDVEMWRKPATQENVRALRARGAIDGGPGRRARSPRGWSGRAGSPPIERIADAVERVVARRDDLAGRARAGQRGAHRGADRSGARAHQPLERPHGLRARRGGARPRRRRDGGDGPDQRRAAARRVAGAGHDARSQMQRRDARGGRCGATSC